MSSTHMTQRSVQERLYMQKYPARHCLCTIGSPSGIPHQSKAQMAPPCPAGHPEVKSAPASHQPSHPPLLWAANVLCLAALHFNGVAKARICSASMVLPSQNGSEGKQAYWLGGTLEHHW